MIEKGQGTQRAFSINANSPALAGLLRTACELPKPTELYQMPTEGKQKSEKLPTITVGFNEANVAEDVMAHLHNGSDRRRVYQRGGKLVHVTQEPDPCSTINAPADMFRVRKLPESILRERISSSVRLVEPAKDAEKQPKRLRPPRWLVEGIHQRGEYPQNVLRLTGIACSPTLRPDGSVLQTPGYDRKTGLLYLPDGEFSPIPQKPSRAEVNSAIAELSDVVCDFPFAGDAHCATWIALVLTLVGRPAIAGPCPLFAFDANTRGSGKSLLVDAAVTIATGDDAPRTAIATSDEEMRKRITAVALEAWQVVLLDNAANALEYASLDAALTGTTWRERLLGRNETTGTLPLNAVWCATGNNISFGADTARRVLCCRLVSPEENPEDRTGFRHPQLLEWLRNDRHRLAVAAVTILRAFAAAGRPDQGLKPWGSYEAWGKLIRGAIVYAGLPDPAETRQEVRNSDRSAEILRLLIDGLEEAAEPLSSADIGRILSDTPDPGKPDPYESLRTAIAELCPNPTNAKIGSSLRSFKGRVCGEKRIATVEMGRNRINHWTVESTAGHAGHAGHETSNLTREKTENEKGNGLKICPASTACPAPPKANQGRTA